MNPSEREEQALILIVQACGIIEDYLYGVTSKESFLKDMLLCDAVSMRLETVGEYVKRLTDETKAKASAYEDKTGAIPTNWKGLAGMRDMLSHRYNVIEFDVVYDTATEELPQLKKTCAYLIAELEKEKQQNYDE